MRRQHSFRFYSRSSTSRSAVARTNNVVRLTLSHADKLNERAVMLDTAESESDLAAPPTPRSQVSLAQVWLLLELLIFTCNCRSHQRVRIILIGLHLCVRLTGGYFLPQIRRMKFTPKRESLKVLSLNLDPLPPGGIHAHTFPHVQAFIRQSSSLSRIRTMRVQRYNNEPSFDVTPFLGCDTL
jgi:hypothetical protein